MSDILYFLNIHIHFLEMYNLEYQPNPALPMGIHADVERTAIEAALAGGKVLSALFSSKESTFTREGHDVKSSADVAAESAIVEVIESPFPTHRIYTEESGHIGGDSDWRWIIDPLDGTNNFESGLPVFGNLVTVTYSGTTEIGVLYVPCMDDLYVVRRGHGLRLNGVPLNPSNDVPLEHATVALELSHTARRDPTLWDVGLAMYQDMQTYLRRPLMTWAPAIQFGLVGQGLLEGLFVYHPRDEEQLFCELLINELQLPYQKGETWYAAGWNASLVTELAAGITTLQEEMLD